MAGVVRSGGGGEWRQLYLNNNKKIKKKTLIEYMLCTKEPAENTASALLLYRLLIRCRLHIGRNKPRIPVTAILGQRPS